MKFVKLNVLTLSVIACLVMLSSCERDTLTSTLETPTHQHNLKCSHLEIPEGLQSEDGLKVRAKQLNCKNDKFS